MWKTGRSDPRGQNAVVGGVAHLHALGPLTGLRCLHRAAGKHSRLSERAGKLLPAQTHELTRNRRRAVSAAVARGVKALVDLRRIHMRSDPVRHLIAEGDSGDQLPAALSERLRHRQRGRHNHRAGMAAGVFVTVVQFDRMGVGGVHHGGMGGGVAVLPANDAAVARAELPARLAQLRGIFPVHAARDRRAERVHNAFLGLLDDLLRQVVIICIGQKRRKLLRQVHQCLTSRITSITVPSRYSTMQATRSLVSMGFGTPVRDSASCWSSSMVTSFKLVFSRSSLSSA